MSSVIFELNDDICACFVLGIGVEMVLKATIVQLRNGVISDMTLGIFYVVSSIKKFCINVTRACHDNDARMS